MRSRQGFPIFSPDSRQIWILSGDDKMTPLITDTGEVAPAAWSSAALSSRRSIFQTDAF